MSKPAGPMMLSLPEVAQLVDRIPIARIVVQSNAVHLRFLQHAAETKMPLRRQCEMFNIPWHARSVPADLAKEPVLEAARILPAAYFMQTLPRELDKLTIWCAAVKTADQKGLTGAALKWVAFHGAENLTDSLITFVGKQKDARPAVSVEEMKARFNRANVVVTIGVDGGMLVRDELISQMIRQQMDAFAERQMDAFAERAILPPLLFEGGELRLRRHQEPFRIGGERGGTAPFARQQSPVEYPEPLRAPFRQGELTLTLLQKPSDFVACGDRLHNCISDVNTGGIFDPRPRRDYFAQAKRGEANLAMICRGAAAVAAVTFDPAWKLIEAKGPRNAVVLDPAILTIANQFSEFAKANAGPARAEPTRDSSA